jgi:hypothetical protein
MPEMKDRQFDPESESLSFPVDAVVGILDEPDAASAALDALVDAGVPEERIQVLCGEAGARRLDPSGKRHGLPGRIKRVIQQFADQEVQHLEHHSEALRAGGYLVAVPAEDEEEGERIAGILKDHGGHFINRYGRWTVQRLEE